METDDEICIGHLRAFGPWILMLMMIHVTIADAVVSRTRGGFFEDRVYAWSKITLLTGKLVVNEWVNELSRLRERVGTAIFLSWSRRSIGMNAVFRRVQAQGI